MYTYIPFFFFYSFPFIHHRAQGRFRKQFSIQNFLWRPHHIYQKVQPIELVKPYFLYFLRLLNSLVLIKSSPGWALKTQIFLAEVVQFRKGNRIRI